MINRNNGSFGNYGNNGSRVVQTPQNGSNSSRPSFGNQRRNNESVDRRSFGNTTIQGQPVGVQPQQMPQRSNNNSSFGGSRQGTTSQPSNFGGSFGRNNGSERTFSFGSESRRLETQPSNSGFNNNNSSRGSFGNSAPRPSMQPNQTIERPTQNSGSFGGHR